MPPVVVKQRPSTPISPGTALCEFATDVLNAVGDRDADPGAELFAHASVTFTGTTLLGRHDINAHYKALFAAAPRSGHLLTNIIIDVTDTQHAVARCRYSRWSIDTDATLLAIGDYHATFRRHQAIGDSLRSQSHKACNVVPNLSNVLATYREWFPYLPLPKLPAIFGLDSAGVVADVGNHVTDVAVGDRVYVNPGISCGGCRACRQGQDQNCDKYTFMGYFSFGADGQQIFDAYPYGGLGEYLTAPQRNLVKLPDRVSFEEGARFGYLGTGYSALRKARVGPGSTVLIDGISGTLGLGSCLTALALGASCCGYGRC